MVVLGQELSCNQSSTTCPGDVVQCECVINGSLQWLAMMPGDHQLEDVLIATYSFLSSTGVPTSGLYTTVLCIVYLLHLLH